MNIGPVTLYGGLQVGGSSGSSPPALHQLEVKERSVSVTMVWPYFTVLSYILDRGRMICPASGGEKENKSQSVQHFGREQEYLNWPGFH